MSCNDSPDVLVKSITDVREFPILNSACSFSPNLILGKTCFIASLTSFFINSPSLVEMEVCPMADCEVLQDCVVDMGMGVILLGCPSNLGYVGGTDPILNNLGDPFSCPKEFCRKLNPAEISGVV